MDRPYDLTPVNKGRARDRDNNDQSVDAWGDGEENDDRVAQFKPPRYVSECRTVIDTGKQELNRTRHVVSSHVLPNSVF